MTATANKTATSAESLATLHAADMPDVEAQFRYRKPLRPGEGMPAFDGNGQSSGEEVYDDPDYTTPTMAVRNARKLGASIDCEGFALVECPSDVENFYDDEEMRAKYHEEMKTAVKKLLAESEGFGKPSFVMTNGHITRNEARALNGEQLGSHHLVHNDFTPAFRSVLSQRTPLIDLFVENGGRGCIFNTWRRFDPAAMRSPLAMCDSTSIVSGDLIATSLANYGSGLEATEQQRDGLGGEGGIPKFDIYQASENLNHR